MGRERIDVGHTLRRDGAGMLSSHSVGARRWRSGRGLHRGRDAGRLRRRRGRALFEHQPPGRTSVRVAAAASNLPRSTGSRESQRKTKQDGAEVMLTGGEVEGNRNRKHCIDYDAGQVSRKELMPVREFAVPSACAPGDARPLGYGGGAGGSRGDACARGFTLTRAGGMKKTRYAIQFAEIRARGQTDTADRTLRTREHSTTITPLHPGQCS